MLIFIDLVKIFCYPLLTGISAHKHRASCQPSKTAGLHSTHTCPGPIFFPAQQPQPWGGTPSPGSHCPPPQPTSPVYLHGSCCSRFHGHRRPSGSISRFSASRCLSYQHRSGQHGITTASVSQPPS